MASTYSDLKIELIGTGEQTGTWGTTTNDNFSIAVGEAITGSADVAFSSADVTLTLTNTNASQAARNLRLNLTGTSGGARNLILGSGCQIEKLYLINNGLADAVTVKNTTGTGIAVPTGKSMFVFNNGTNVVEATSGDIFGPASSTDNAVARFDGTTGKAIQNSVVTIADSTGNMAGVGTISSGAITSSSLTSGRVLYAGTSGLIQDDADFTFNGTTVTMANDASISGLTVGKGGGAVSTNTAIGTNALDSNTSGTTNTAIGYQAGQLNTSGTNNTLVGRWAGKANTTGSGNTFVGDITAFVNTTGSYNTTLGNDTLRTNTTGSNNTAVGYRVMYESTGSSNTGVGFESLRLNTTASNNTAVGYQAAYSNTTGTSIEAFGYQALYANTTGANNSAFGFYALQANTTGSGNNAFGRGALAANTTGTNNTAFGYPALNANTTGSQNTAVGTDALAANTTASNNTAVGYQAGYSGTTAANNVAMGYQALYSNATGGGRNTAIGNVAGYGVTTGEACSFFGDFAGYGNTTGSNNTYIGRAAGYLMTTGSKNTILGRFDGNQGGLDIRTASNYIVLSDGDGNPNLIINNNKIMSVGTTATDNPAGGFVLYVANQNSQFMIGHETGTPSGYNFAKFCYNSSSIGSITQNGTTAVAYNTTSDYRLKADVAPIQNALATIEALNPVSFTWVDGRADDGFLAHEIQAVLPNCVTGEKDAVNEDGTPKYQQMDNSGVIPFLVKAIQELKAEVDSLKQQLGK